MKCIFLLLILVFTSNVQAVSEELLEAIDDLKAQDVEYKDFLKHLLPKKSYDRLRYVLSSPIETGSNEIFKLYFDIRPSLETLISKDLETLKHISRFPDPNRSSILDPQFEPLLQELANTEFSKFFLEAKKHTLIIDDHSFFAARANNFRWTLNKIFANGYSSIENFHIPLNKDAIYYPVICKFLEQDDLYVLAGFNFKDSSYLRLQNYLRESGAIFDIPLAILIAKIENYAWIASGLIDEPRFPDGMISFRIQSELMYLAWKD